MDPSTHLAVLRERQDLRQRARTLLTACTSFRTQCASDELTYAPAERLALVKPWVENFTALNTIPEGGTMSAADMVFAAQCLSLACEENLFERVLTVDIAIAWAHLAVIASQHTAESRVFWPSASRWQGVQRLIAAVYVTFFHVDASERLALGGRLASDSGVLAENDDLQLVDVSLKAEFAERREPPALAAEKEENKKTLERKRQLGRKLDREDYGEAAVEAMGLMWRTSGEEIAANFVRFASRIWFVMEREQLLHQVLPLRARPVRFSEHARQAEIRWLIDRCSREQTDEFQKKFRDVATFLLHPLGAETQRFRNVHTMDTGTSATQILGAELGAELSRFLAERLDIHPAKLATTPSSPFWAALYLCSINLRYEQNVNLKWLSEYVFCEATSTPDVHYSQLARKRIAALHYRGVTNKCPIWVRVQRTWRLAYRGEWWQVGDEIDAYLLWKHLLRLHHGNHTENFEDISDVVAGIHSEPPCPLPEEEEEEEAKTNNPAL